MERGCDEARDGKGDVPSVMLALTDHTHMDFSPLCLTFVLQFHVSCQIIIFIQLVFLGVKIGGKGSCWKRSTLG